MRIVLCLAALLLAPAAIAAGKGEGKVTIRNKSSWEIQELYLSAVDANTWGPDQLGLDTIEHGKTFRLGEIPCDSYDVRIVNEDGDECMISGAVLCADHDAWTVTDDDLAACPAAAE